MAIEKMSLINIYGNRDKLNDVIFSLSDEKMFYPQLPPVHMPCEKGFTPLKEENQYSALLARMNSIADSAGLNLSGVKSSRPTISEAEAENFVEDFRAEYLAIGNSRNSVLRAKQNLESVIITMRHLSGLGEISIDEIKSCEYFDARFGKLPIDAYKKLELFSEHPFAFIELGRDRDYIWGVYFTLMEYAALTEDTFSSLYFEFVTIPEYIHGSTEEAIKLLSDEIAAQDEALNEISDKVRLLVTKNTGRFTEIYAQTKYMNESFDMRKYVGVSGSMFHILGFMPEHAAKSFVAGLNAIDTVTASAAPDDTIKRLTPPTKLRNNSFVKPFEIFTGLPAYGSVDTTSFIAWAFFILFGIAFEDVGLGIVLLIAGAIFNKNSFGGVLGRLGLSSVLFGLLRGCIFGSKKMLDPIYHAIGMRSSPIALIDSHSANIALLAVVGVGISLLIFSFLIRIVYSFRRQR